MTKTVKAASAKPTLEDAIAGFDALVDAALGYGEESSPENAAELRAQALEGAG